MSRFLQAVRGATARPAFAVTVVLSLALGIGANALLYAIVDAAILRPLPFPDLDRLVGIGADYPRLNQPLEFFEAFSGPEYVDISESIPSLQHVTGFDLGNEHIVVGDAPERVFTAYTWADPFRVMGVSPARGRGFEATELARAARVAIVSYAFWQTRFAGAEAIVGTRLPISGQPFTIVGVLPRGATLYGADLWIPFSESPIAIGRNRRQFNIVARLRDGATVDGANAELRTLARRIESTHAGEFPEYSGWDLRAERWTRVDQWPFARSTLIAFAGAGLLLLLVSANLANLALARAGSREREFAIRAALGASRRRLAGSMLAEVMLLATSGAIGGLALAMAGARVLPGVLPASMLPFADSAFAIDWRLIAFGVLAAFATGAVVAVGPALHAARTDVRDILAQNSSTLASTRGSRFQRLIVAMEVALAAIVASAAVLLGSNVARLLRVDPGFPTEGLVGMRLTLPLQRYDGDARIRFFETLLEHVRALPDVDGATVTMQYPPNAFTTSQFAIEGRDTSGALPSAFHTVTASRLLQTLHVPLIAGRWLNDEASFAAPLEVVINEVAAQRYFPNGAVGKRIRIAGPGGDSRWARIVGVTRAVRNRGPAANAQPEIFTSLRQAPERRRSQLFLLVRSRGGTDAMGATVTAIRTIVRGMDPEQPVYGISSVDANFVAALGSRRVAAQLLIAFGVVGLALAALGIYGVLSYTVAQRTREIGLRMALGAGRARLMRLVALQALVPAGIGLAFGCAVLFVARQSIGAFLFGVNADPMAIFLVAAAVAVVAAGATIVPAQRAMRVDPLEALREG
jgi:putative ABC transport system permease protein